VITTATRTDEGVRLRWASTDRRTREYAVYRVRGGWDRCALVDARHRIATVRADARPWLLDEHAPSGRVTYVVTALDRVHNEGRGSLPRPVG
jgi:hypothetical protein